MDVEQREAMAVMERGRYQLRWVRLVNGEPEVEQTAHEDERVLLIARAQLARNPAVQQILLTGPRAAA